VGRVLFNGNTSAGIALKQSILRMPKNGVILFKNEGPNDNNLILMIDVIAKSVKK